MKKFAIVFCDTDGYPVMFAYGQCDTPEERVRLADQEVAYYLDLQHRIDEMKKKCKVYGDWVYKFHGRVKRSPLLQGALERVEDESKG